MCAAQDWLREAAGFPLLPLAELVWVEAVRDYVHLHAGPRSRLVRATMSQAEAHLAPAGFLRVHRSVLVRGDGVTGLRRRGRRGLEVHLAAAGWLPVAPTRARALVEQLGAQAERDVIFVGCGRERRRVDLAAVSLVRAEGDYVRLFAAGREHLHRATLKHVQTLFPPGEMIRIGRSVLARRGAQMPADASRAPGLACSASSIAVHTAGA